jgi:hypothetical protein
VIFVPPASAASKWPSPRHLGQDASKTLAILDSTNHMLLDVSNPSGPAAPVAGGPGVPVRFDSAATEPIGTTTSGRYRTQVDQNGNVTLFDAYDSKGRPARKVEGRDCGRTGDCGSGHEHGSCSECSLPKLASSQLQYQRGDMAHPSVIALAIPA